MIATEEVWRRNREGLKAFLRRRVRDEHLAEDLLQETFVRIHDGLEGLEDERRLGPWVLRIARRVLADHLRRASPEGGLDPEALTEDADDAEGDANLNAEVEGWLRSMIGLLPEEFRDALVMTEIEGLTQREVAERLGLSLSGAKSRVQRARARLREVLLACCHLEFDRRGNVIGYRRRGTCEGC